MILYATVLTVLTGCASAGSVGLVEDPERAHLVRGVIDGEEFVLRHAATARMQRGHYRFAMFLWDVEADYCDVQPAVRPHLSVGIGLPLEVGTWMLDDPDVNGGAVSRQQADEGLSISAAEGWASVDEIRIPWEDDGEAWVSGALELRTRDGSWVAGRFEEVPLCYFEP